MDVQVTGGGAQGDIELQIDPTFQAARVSLKPLEYGEPGKLGLGGHYYAATASGALTGVGAAGVIYAFRWSDSKYLAVLQKVSMVYYLTTAYTGAQMNDFDIVSCTSFTTSYTGGNAVTPIPKRRAAMASASAATDVRMSSTAALTAGSPAPTIDGSSLNYVADGPPNVAIPTATLAVPRQELVLYDHKEAGHHAKVFGKDEGFLVRAVTAMSAAGVIKAFIRAEWAEVSQY